MKKNALLLLSLLLGLNAMAEPQTVTLEVPGMNCVTCPFTVKKALLKIVGVNKVDVTYENKLAIVTFDDEKTGLKSLTDATANAGYPSVLKE